jgi:peptidoglycan/LPS O-acetylase OafA/YrhL
VLSGFLITGILLDSREAKNYFSAFYMRRILRIFPLYYFALLLVLGLIIPLERIPLQFHDAIWYFVYAQNWTLAIIPHLGHFWSLGIEEQFYFIWPLVVWAAGRRRVFQIAIAGSLFSLVLRLFLVSRHVDVVLIYHNLFTRMDTLLVGAACACIIRESPSFKLLAANRWLCLLPGFTLPLIRIASHAAGDRFVVNQTVGYTLVALSYGGLLLCLVSTLGDPTVEQRFFNSSIMRWFGKYSYGAYVWHQLVQHGVLTTEQTMHIRLPWFVQIPILLAATALVSVCSYAIVERPFLALKRYFEPREA